MKIKNLKKNNTTIHRMKTEYSIDSEDKPDNFETTDTPYSFNPDNGAIASLRDYCDEAACGFLEAKANAVVRQLELAKDFLEQGRRIVGASSVKGSGENGVVPGSHATIGGVARLLDVALDSTDHIIRLAVAQLCAVSTDRLNASLSKEAVGGVTTQQPLSIMNELDYANRRIRDRDELIEKLRVGEQSMRYEILLAKENLDDARDECRKKDQEIEQLVQKNNALTLELENSARLAEAEEKKQRREQKKLQDNLLKVRDKYEEYKRDTLKNAALLRLVYKSYGDLKTQVERLGREAENGRLSVDRVKGHLSYRLGNILVKNTDSLRGYLTLPSRLLVEHRKFKSEKNLVPQLDKLNLVKRELAPDQFVFLKAKTPNLFSYIFNVGRSLSLDLSAPILGKVVEFQLLTKEISNTPVADIILPDGERRQITSNPISITLRAGRERLLIIPIVSGVVDMELRVVSGLPAIAIIRPTEAPPLQLNNTGRVVLPNEQGGRVDSKPAAIALSPAEADISQIISPKPMKNGIILQAHTLMEQGYSKAGIQFAQLHARSEIRSAVDLLEANTCLDNDEKWLGCVNRYIENFGTAAICLKSGWGEKFSRLSTERLPIVERGPLVTVIMPAFNSASTVSHAVESILRQTWRNIELLIVDDCSSDNTWAVLTQLAQNDGRIKLFRNKNNVGPYVSKNTALMHAKGAYITGHDADDWAHPDRIKKQVEFLLNSNGKYLANVAKMLRIQRNGRFSFISKENSISPDGILREAAISCMFDRKFFSENLGYWDCVRFGADSEMMSRARKIMGERFQRVDIISMLCLDEEGSLTNDPQHGISKTAGVSPTRMFYKEQWTAWHRTMTQAHSRIDFPYAKREFVAPDAALVPIELIRENIACASDG